MAISVYIVDDHEEIRCALERLIKRSNGFELLGSSSGFQEALIWIPLVQPDVVLLDIQLGKNENGIDIIRQLKPEHPRISFMICTAFDDDEKIIPALQAGAGGYILKKMPPDRILDSIRELKEGGIPISSQVIRKLVHALQLDRAPVTPSEQPLPGLTAREHEILEQLARGLLYKEIAAKLYISQETVRKHAYHIYEKLEVSNRVEAINKFFGR